MKNRKQDGLLKNLIVQQDEQEYERVKNRMRVAVKIADALREKGLSQKAFAEKLGKKPSEISKWLSGTHNFTLDTLIDIQSVLGVELINASIKSESLARYRYEVASKLSPYLAKA